MSDLTKYCPIHEAELTPCKVCASQVTTATPTPRTDIESEGNYFSNTPRVNKLREELKKPSDGDRMDMISLARQLERELTAAQAEIAELRKLIEHTYIHSNYKNCGFMEMTTSEKQLFVSILENGFPETVEQLRSAIDTAMKPEDSKP